MTRAEQALAAFEAWYKQLALNAGFPAKGTIAGALVVLEQLKQVFDLDIEQHTASGGSQIIGASGARVKQLLARYGETRPFVSEGGRTNRGLRGDIRNMLEAIQSMQLELCNDEERALILEDMQKFLVAQIHLWHNRQRLKIEYDPRKSTRALIKHLLGVARESGKGGQVAQYLIGAKLERRFENLGIAVTNESYSTADKQLNRQGDFLIIDTVFHVTLVPMGAVFDKCKRNLDDGYRVVLLVPDDVIQGARQNAELTTPGQIAVESLESFIAQNIDEMALFSKAKLAQELLALLETYNKRVDATEIDKSIMIEIPARLQRSVE